MKLDRMKWNKISFHFYFIISFSFHYFIFISLFHFHFIISFSFHYFTFTSFYLKFHFVLFHIISFYFKIFIWLSHYIYVAFQIAFFNTHVHEMKFQLSFHYQLHYSLNITHWIFLSYFDWLKNIMNEFVSFDFFVTFFFLKMSLWILTMSQILKMKLRQSLFLNLIKCII